MIKSCTEDLKGILDERNNTLKREWRSIEMVMLWECGCRLRVIKS
jgi:hypothetical protein